MTEEEQRIDRLISLCYNQLDKFTEVDTFEQLPKDIKITVYCKSITGIEEGLRVNIMAEDMGLEALIVRKYIAHSELEKLVGEPIDIE